MLVVANSLRDPSACNKRSVTPMNAAERQLDQLHEFLAQHKRPAGLTVSEFVAREAAAGSVDVLASGIFTGAGDDDPTPAPAPIVAPAVVAREQRLASQQLPAAKKLSTRAPSRPIVQSERVMTATNRRVARCVAGRDCGRDQKEAASKEAEGAACLSQSRGAGFFLLDRRVAASADPGKPVMWTCLCLCGELGKVAGTNLVRKQSTRCRACAKRAATKRAAMC